MLDREQPRDPAPAPAVKGAAPAADHGVIAAVAARPLIEPGMDHATVRAIQGEPMQHDDRDWLYGPSWIRFEKGRVVDWYSSPLHRLQTAKQAPTQEEIDAAAAR